MQTDILIVGGGLSGLALADRLNVVGADWLLIEAQDRLGGRIKTEHYGGAAFDIGPAWFWPGQPRMAGLVDRFGLGVFEQHTAGDVVVQDRNGHIRQGFGPGGMHGSYRLAGGVGRVIEALHSVLPSDRLHLGTQLTSLNQSGIGIEARAQQAKGPIEITARRVVLALPPRVVVEMIRFDPALTPEQTAAMTEIPTWMAGQAKVLAIYDVPHWRIAGLSGDAMSQLGPMVEIHDASPLDTCLGALFGFIGVPPDARIAHRDQLLDLALKQFGALFGPDMAQPKHAVLMDWATVPEVATDLDRMPLRAHPAYGLPKVLSTLWDGALQLGSTETAAAFGGYLEGALEAAERVAQNLG